MYIIIKDPNNNKNEELFMILLQNCLFKKRQSSWKISQKSHRKYVRVM